MPLFATSQQAIQTLKYRYDALPSYAKWFFPSSLGGALSVYQTNSTHETEQALNICTNFLNKTWSVQRWIFSFFDSCLDEFARTSLVTSAKELLGAGLLNEDSAQANFNAVASHQDPWGVVDALLALNRAGLLVGDSAQANRDAVAGHQDSRYFADVLVTLDRASLLTGDGAQANRDVVAGHQDLWRINNALAVFYRAGLLTGVSAQANFNAVVGHQDPQAVINVLYILNGLGLLMGDSAQANFNAVVGHQYLEAVTEALCILYDSGLLTGDRAQANFNVLLITHSAILLHADTGYLWSSIPNDFFTQQRFDEIIVICNTYRENVAAGRVRFIAYVAREILGINGSQSTHTASVHESVSSSATKLKEHYGDKIHGCALQEALHEFSEWLQKQPEDFSEKIKAAKRCLPRLTAEDYHFIDPVSAVSTKQLLALMWIAIHDEERRQSSLEDVLSAFVEGLYEIQREYNISDKGVDNGAVDDKSACPAGTFNKIVEKGAGILPDVEIVFKTLVGFNLKFPRVVCEEAMIYLRGLSSRGLGLLFEEIKQDNSVAAIWDSIKEPITNKMFDEFGSLFQNNRELPAFISIIATGEYLVLSSDDIQALEQSLSSASASSQGFFALAEASEPPRAEDGFDDGEDMMCYQGNRI